MSSEALNQLELLAMARRIVAEDYDAQGQGISAIYIRCGGDKTDPRLRIALAAIIETTEAAAKYVHNWKGVPVPDGDCDCLAYDLRSGDHLKGTQP